jgi:streptomycin 6-kinase
VLQWIVAWTGLSAAWFIGDSDQRDAQIDLEVNALALRLAMP